MVGYDLEHFRNYDVKSNYVKRRLEGKTLKELKRKEVDLVELIILEQRVLGKETGWGMGYSMLYSNLDWKRKADYEAIFKELRPKAFEKYKEEEAKLELQAEKEYKEERRKQRLEDQKKKNEFGKWLQRQGVKQ